MIMVVKRLNVQNHEHFRLYSVVKDHESFWGDRPDLPRRNQGHNLAPIYSATATPQRSELLEPRRSNDLRFLRYKDKMIP